MEIQLIWSSGLCVCVGPVTIPVQEHCTQYRQWGGTGELIGAQQWIFAWGPPSRLIWPLHLQLINATSPLAQLAALQGCTLLLLAVLKWLWLHILSTN